MAVWRLEEMCLKMSLESVQRSRGTDGEWQIVHTLYQTFSLKCFFSKQNITLCLLLDTNLNISTSYITSAPSTFKVILQLTPCINYLLTYLCRTCSKSKLLSTKSLHRRVYNVHGVVFSRVLRGLFCGSTTQPAWRQGAKHPAAAVSATASGTELCTLNGQGTQSPTGKVTAHLVCKWEGSWRH